MQFARSDGSRQPLSGWDSHTSGKLFRVEYMLLLSHCFRHNSCHAGLMERHTALLGVAAA
jgi:hypothetical protein